VWPKMARHTTSQWPHWLNIFRKIFSHDKDHNRGQFNGNCGKQISEYHVTGSTVWHMAVQFICIFNNANCIESKNARFIDRMCHEEKIN
jgi:hypothetical protein